MLSKVPEVTIFFWIIFLAAITVVVAYLTKTKKDQVVVNVATGATTSW